jgi:chaperonin GroES
MTVLKPKQDCVAVRRDEHVTKTAGGIIIARDKDAAKPITGTVLAVGPGLRNDAGVRVKIDLKAGSHVVFAGYAGTPITVGGEEIHLMREADILAELVE